PRGFDLFRLQIGIEVDRAVDAERFDEVLDALILLSARDVDHAHVTTEERAKVRLALVAALLDRLVQLLFGVRVVGGEVILVHRRLLQLLRLRILGERCARQEEHCKDGNKDVNEPLHGRRTLPDQVRYGPGTCLPKGGEKSPKDPPLAGDDGVTDWARGPRSG